MSHIATNWAFAVRGIPPLAKLVLIALADRHNKDTNLCCPDQRMLADDVAMGERTARKYLSILESGGFISRLKRSKGVGITTYYTLHFAVLTPQEVEPNQQDVPEGPTGTGRSTNRHVEDDQTASACRNKVTGSNRKEPSVSKDTAQNELFEKSKPKRQTPAHASADRATKTELQKAGVFSMGLPMLMAEDVPEKVARAFLGKLIADSSVAIAYQAVQAAVADPPIDARSFLRACLQRKAQAAGVQIKSASGATPEAIDWDAAVARWWSDDIWNRKRLGEQPDEWGYAGPLAPIEAIFANGKIGDPRIVGLKTNFDALKAKIRTP